jgi:preprotein translocase subunit SecY
MVVSRDKASHGTGNVYANGTSGGLRGRLLITLGLLILLRFGMFVPIPGLNRARLAEIIQGNAALGILDLFTGEDYRR